MTLTLTASPDQDVQFYTNGFELLPVIPVDPLIPGFWLTESEMRRLGSAEGWLVAPTREFLGIPQYMEGYFQGFKSRLRAIAVGHVPGTAGNLKAACQPGDLDPF